jgi:hypothetical protein
VLQGFLTSKVFGGLLEAKSPQQKPEAPKRRKTNAEKDYTIIRNESKEREAQNRKPPKAV